MAISSKPFGTLPDGRKAVLFTLDGGEGVQVAITNYGGIITSIRTPDKNGGQGDIGLGFETLDGYLAKPNYFGALIGRVANRIRGGKFTLDGKEYRLWTDAKGIHLHGGREGFNKRLWKAETLADGVRLEYVSPDGEEEYPGKLAAVVEYTLVGRDLRLEYTATTDKPTIVNLTNHSFFNLNCCEGDVLTHQLRMNADRYTPADETLLPTGEVAGVGGTPFDFREAKAIGRDMGNVPGGYDHNFVFTDGAGGLEGSLIDVYEPVSGRTMSMTTTEPCVQFYGGNFLDGSDVGIGGKVYGKHYGFCLEAQKHPDAVNQPNFASPVLRPGETYRQTTIYRFGVR